MVHFFIILFGIYIYYLIEKNTDLEFKRTILGKFFRVAYFIVFFLVTIPRIFEEEFRMTVKGVGDFIYLYVSFNDFVHYKTEIDNAAFSFEELSFTRIFRTRKMKTVSEELLLDIANHDGQLNKYYEVHLAVERQNDDSYFIFSKWKRLKIGEARIKKRLVFKEIIFRWDGNSIKKGLRKKDRRGEILLKERYAEKRLIPGLLRSSS